MPKIVLVTPLSPEECRRRLRGALGADRPRRGTLLRGVVRSRSFVVREPYHWWSKGHDRQGVIGRIAEGAGGGARIECRFDPKLLRIAVAIALIGLFGYVLRRDLGVLAAAAATMTCLELVSAYVGRRSRRHARDYIVSFIRTTTEAKDA